MASVTYRAHRKTKSGDYEVAHFETESGVVQRPNGKTVEQSLVTVETHVSATGNPHNTTKSDIGLDKVDNTADVDKSVKYANNADKVDGFDMSLGTSDIGSGAALSNNMIYLVREE